MVKDLCEMLESELQIKSDIVEGFRVLEGMLTSVMF